MKVKIRITVDDTPRGVKEMVHTNHMPGRRVMSYEREVEIPDPPCDWVLDRVDIVEREDGGDT